MAVAPSLNRADRQSKRKILHGLVLPPIPRCQWMMKKQKKGSLRQMTLWRLPIYQALRHLQEP